MNRTAKKAIRDVVVVAAGSLLVALGQDAVGFGVPPEAAPVVAAVALALWRVLRDGTPVRRIDPR